MWLGAAMSAKNQRSAPMLGCARKSRYHNRNRLVLEERKPKLDGKNCTPALVTDQAPPVRQIQTTTPLLPSLANDDRSRPQCQEAAAAAQHPTAGAAPGVVPPLDS